MKISVFYSVASVFFLVVGILLNKFYDKLQERTEKTESKLDDLALKFAKIGVDYVNTNFFNSSNESKKQRAVDIVKMKLSEAGIKDVADSAIHSAVEMAVTKSKIAEVETLKDIDKLGVIAPDEKK